jgi:two-component system cell cycle sensor histidine kinase/response regulator CckA
MEIMPVGVCWLDDNGNIEYANCHMVALFGYNLADIPTIGEWFSNAHPDPVCRDSYMASWNAWIAEAKANASPIPPTEVKVTCKDGTIKHVIVNTQVARNRVLIIFTDITEREYMQNELLAIQKLESLGVLAGEIAHDFKNILTVIIGNISFVRTFLLDASHTSQKPLEDAEEASRRAADLARRFLTFAKGGQAGQESRFSAPTHT